MVARIGASTRLRVVESRVLKVKGKGDITCSFVDSVAAGRGRRMPLAARPSSFLRGEARAVYMMAHSILAEAGLAMAPGLEGPLINSGGSIVQYGFHSGASSVVGTPHMSRTNSSQPSHPLALSTGPAAPISSAAAHQVLD